MSKSPAGETRFVEAMYAVSVRELPEGQVAIRNQTRWLSLYRAHDSTGVKLWSRRANSFTTQFLAIAQACQMLPQHCPSRVGTVAADDGRRVATGDSRGLSSR